MKQVFVLSTLLLVFAQAVTAQNANLNPCGTTDVPENIARWIQEKQEHPTDYRSQMPATVYIPIQFHLVGTTEGTGFYPAADVFRLLCDVNEQYLPVGFHFYNYNEFDYIYNSNYYIHDYDAGENMMDDYNVNGAVNVYIVDDPAGNCGYFSWGGNAVAIAKSCADAGETTLAHELGHFFFLPHTFRGWEGRWEDGVLVDPLPNGQRERVNGSNCASTGDFFCDTPADYLSYRWQCPYTGILNDPNGTPIDPDETLYMSYAYDACTRRFSEQQINTMIAGLFEERSELLDHPIPNAEEVGNTYLFYPGSGSMEVNPNHVLIKWSQTPGATTYYVEVMQYTDIVNGTNFKGYVNATEITLQLDPGVPYYFTIQPLNPGNTCGGRITGNFVTAATETLYLKSLNILMPACNNDVSGIVSVEAAGGQQPYTYLWSNGNQGATQTGLSAGQYLITVTDATGTNNTLILNVPQPAELQAEVVQTDNFNATLTINGGTIPYSAAWSNGETGFTANGLTVGENTATITDANGCTLAVNVNTLAIQAYAASITCNGQNDGSINLQLFGGTEPYTYNWSNGSTDGVLYNLSEGVYSVTATDAAGTEVQLSYTITNPAPMSALATINGTTVNVQTTGGTPPYIYYFPSGASTTASASVAGFPNGSYEVWVNDFNGCLAIAPFTLVSVGIDNPNSPNSEVAVYPSIVHKGNPLFVELRGNLFRNAAAGATVFNAEGKLCGYFVCNVSEGSLITLDTANYPAGTYFIHFHSANEVYISRFTVVE